MRFVLASNNQKKLREMADILCTLGHSVISMQEAGISAEPEETGATFEENARIKARAAAALCGEPCLADDSGLEVEALNGEPGVYSARYAGEVHNDVANIQLLLRNMEKINDRDAYQQTVLVLMFPDGRYYFGEGSVQGTIT
ncbi:MAG: non-canonical purine NTP pyrophosphatase, partial [Clostridia bacterium]|nr:non-canonical purine NTP pyrophosphatase [Clostridia bacterium]